MTSAISTGRKHGYSSLQIAFHWTTVGLVAFQWFLGQSMEPIYEARSEGVAMAQMGPAYMHIAIGVTILIVMVARLGAKLKRNVQVAPDSDHPWARLLGQANHWAFYILLISLPLGGLLAWYGRSDAAASLHSFLANALPWFIAVHVLGALTHQYVFRDGLINRIVRPGPGT